jgi:propanol-preferring alcohol dehydrogenase
MDYLRPTGSAMIVGLPPAGATVPAECRATVIGMKSVRGCFVGTKRDVMEALDIVAGGAFVPAVKVVPFNQLQATYDQMKDGTLLGRAVLDREFWGCKWRYFKLTVAVWK